MNPRKRTRPGPRGTFGDYLRDARKALGLTQQALAVLLGVEQPVVAKWESGSRKPSPLTHRGVEALIAEEKARRKNR